MKLKGNIVGQDGGGANEAKPTRRFQRMFPHVRRRTRGLPRAAARCESAARLRQISASKIRTCAGAIAWSHLEITHDVIAILRWKLTKIGRYLLPTLRLNKWKFLIWTDFLSARRINEFRIHTSRTKANHVIL